MEINWFGKMAQTGGKCTIMGNAERNTYVKNRITETTIRLLKEKPLTDISISEIIQEAQVSRNSFYRNYQEKEDILRAHIRALFQGWKDAYEKTGKSGNQELYCSMFTHLKEHSRFYFLLRDRQLFSLFQEVFLEQNGSSNIPDNIPAYVVAFITYGTYGWIDEWMKRGMRESPKEMAALLVARGQS